MSDEKGGYNWRALGAIGGSVVVMLLFVALAFVLNGVFAAIAFTIALVIGAGTPLAAIYLLKDGTPLGGMLSKGTAILAQMTFGSGAIVRREDGSYEWHRLQETDAGRYVVRLDDDTVLNPSGDRGDLYRFAGRPLAIFEEKGQNVEQFTVQDAPKETAEPSTRETRAGLDVHHPSRVVKDNYLISLKQLAEPISGSAGPQLAQRGRAKALEEAGGQQGFSGFLLTLITGGMVTLGFVLGYGAMLL